MWKGETDNNWAQNQWENTVDSQEKPLNNQWNELENEQKQMNQQDFGYNQGWNNDASYWERKRPPVKYK